MFLAEEDLTLHITRGDAGEIVVRAIDETTDGGETPYIFKAGEVLRLKVYEKKNCSKVVLQKDYPVVKDAETVTLALTEADTKIGDTISKPVDYWYEIELNPFTEPQTIVGYDEDGAKILRLYPEGLDTEYIPPTPEEVGAVDKELDLTSERAIQNQAVTRAIVQLESTVEKNNTKTTEELAKAKEDVALLKARVTNLATIEEGSTTADAEIIDARVGADGTVYDSLGNAIRSQTADIATTLNDIDHYLAKKSAEINIQGFVVNDGTINTSNSKTMRSDYISVNGYNKITYTCVMTTAGYMIAFFDGNKNIIQDASVLGTGKVVTNGIVDIPTDAKYVIISTLPASTVGEILVYSTENLVDRVGVLEEEIKNPTIPDESISVEKLNFVEKSPNLFDRSKPVENGYYQSNSVIQRPEGSSRTISILNKGYEAITTSFIQYYYSFWNAENELISVHNAGGVLENYTISAIPENTHIIKITVTNTTVDDLMVVNGEVETVPDWQPFGYRETNNLDINELKEDVKTLKDKKIMFFGDSITDPQYSTYLENLLSYTGLANVGNFAISGSKLCHTEVLPSTLDGLHTTNKSVPNQVQYLINNINNNSATYETPDIVFIFAGTNDSTGVADLDEEQFTTSLDSCDLTTFSGSMRWTYEKLMTLYPNALVVFVTPLQSARTGREYNTMILRRNGIIANCERLALDYIDAFRVSGIYSGFELHRANGKYLGDGLHPNVEGGVKLAKCFQNELMQLIYKI